VKRKRPTSMTEPKMYQMILAKRLLAVKAQLDTLQAERAAIVGKLGVCDYAIPDGFRTIRLRIVDRVSRCVSIRDLSQYVSADILNRCRRARSGKVVRVNYVKEDTDEPQD